MKVQNPNEEKSEWTTKDDPRKTRVGNFIRKTSIDELPQFFNVLKGDMSVIGPRPERPYFVEEFKEKMFSSEKFVDYIITYTNHMPFNPEKGNCKIRVKWIILNNRAWFLGHFFRDGSPGPGKYGFLRQLPSEFGLQKSED